MRKNWKYCVVFVCLFVMSFCCDVPFVYAKQDITFYFIDKDAVLEVIPGYQKAIKSIQSYQEEEQKKIMDYQKEAEELNTRRNEIKKRIESITQDENYDDDSSINELKREETEIEQRLGNIQQEYAGLEHKVRSYMDKVLKPYNEKYAKYLDNFSVLECKDQGVVVFLRKSYVENSDDYLKSNQLDITDKVIDFIKKQIELNKNKKAQKS